MRFPNRTLQIIFDRLQKEIFDEYSIELKSPLSVVDQKIGSILSGSFKHFTTLRNGNYYTEISIRSGIDISKPKRDLLLKLLKEHNVETIAGSRMKIVVRTRSFVFAFRHYVKSTKSINKFNL